MQSVARPLSKTQALHNLACLVGTVQVQLTLVLGEESITGDVKLLFESARDTELYLWYVGQVSRVSGVEAHRHDGQVLAVSCKKGANCLVVGFESRYAETWGAGLLKRQLPDGSQYLFTVNESCGTSKLFPVFDQPSVRCSFALNLLYPEAWGAVHSNGEILAATSEPQPHSHAPGQSLCSCSHKQAQEAPAKVRLPDSSGQLRDFAHAVFGETEPIAPYLFYIHIGHFVQLESSRPSPLPASFFCLPHAKHKLEKALDALSFTTQTALAFLEEFFGRQYAFKKYHHLFVPSELFQMCALELPGMVCVDEYMLDVDSDYYWVDWLFLLCHEMVHMWFGDLVAIEFWDSNWMKESFADLIALIALEHVIEAASKAGADLLFGNKQQADQRLRMIKMKRRVEGYSCAQSMIRCGRCRPIQKNDIEYSDESVACYGDDIYGKSLFDVYQFFSAYPDNLRDFCRGVVRDWQWTYVNEERFLQTIASLEQMNAILSPELVQASYHRYFKEVGYDSFSFELQDHQLLIRLDPAAVSRNHRLQVGFLAADGARQQVFLVIDPRGKLVNSWTSSGVSAESLIETDQPAAILIRGSQFVVDPSIWASSLPRLDFDSYLSQMSDAQVSQCFPLILSQLLTAGSPAISKESFDRLTRPALAEHRDLFGWWFGFLQAYVQSSGVETPLLADFVQESFEAFLALKQVKQDYLKLFDLRLPQVQGDRSAVALILEQHAKLLQQGHPSDKHFDYVFHKVFCYNHDVPVDRRKAIVELTAEELPARLRRHVDSCEERLLLEILSYSKVLQRTPHIREQARLEAKERGGNLHVFDV